LQRNKISLRLGAVAQSKVELRPLYKGLLVLRIELQSTSQVSQCLFILLLAQIDSEPLIKIIGITGFSLYDLDTIMD
jgi:hypothetical protein